MNSNVTYILIAISFCHFLNDIIQSLIPAIYPILKENYNLTFTQIGLITLAFQLTASVLQPLVGFYTDKKPRPYSLVFGMIYTWFGLLVLSAAQNFYSIILGAMLVGSGSSIFHPESSRIARLASKGKFGFAQSLFQVGGNIGSSLGPLLAALIVLPYGQKSLSWFSLMTICAIIILFRIGKWYKAAHLNAAKAAVIHKVKATKKEIITAITVLVALIFSKYFYSACLNNYYTFYLISKFNLSVAQAQVHLFYFLAACAAGALLGGIISDKVGRRNLMWFSVLGALPFTLALPYADLFWVKIFSVLVGLILSSTFSSIVVYAQELIPGKVGTIAGLFFGLAFGMAAIGAALLGKLADIAGIAYVFELCSYLPLLGLLVWFLPKIENRK